MSTVLSARADVASAHTSAQVIHAGDCVIFGGPMDVATLIAATDAAKDLIVIAHLRSHAGGAASHGDRARTRTLVFTDPAALPTTGWTVILGAAAPRARITTAGAPVSEELVQTPLVRAAHSTLWSLLRERPDSVESEAGTEDFVLTVMRLALANAQTSSGSDLRGVSLTARLASLIEERHTDAGLDVAMLADELHISRRQLYRIADGGGGIASMLARRRIATAQRLLADSELTIAEVAERAGFSSAARMRAHFVRETHCTPKEFRHREQSDRAPVDDLIAPMRHLPTQRPERTAFSQAPRVALVPPVPGRQHPRRFAV